MASLGVVLQVFPVDGGPASADDAMVTSRQLGINAMVAIGGVSVVIAVTGAFIAPGNRSTVAMLAWTLLAVLPIYAIGVWLTRRRPGHPQAFRLLLLGTATAVGTAMERIIGPFYDANGAGDWFWWINLLYELVSTLTAIAAALLFATYPDGIVEKHWQRVIVRATWAMLALPVLLVLSSPTLVINQYLLKPIPVVPNPVAIPLLAPLAPTLTLLQQSYLAGFVAITLLLIRYRQANAVERRRMRMLVITIVAGVPVLLAAFVLKAIGFAPDSPVVIAVEFLYMPIMVMIPVSIVVGVMRYGMYEIDVIVRRSVVFGALSAGIAVIYIALAAAPGLALGDQIPVPLAVVITIAAVLAFAPLRRRLEKIADRWVFGTRINRYQLLTTFGSNLEQTAGLTDLLPRLADTVRQGLAASWVRVRLQGNEYVSGTPVEPAELTVPLERADRGGTGWSVLGSIDCGPKKHGYEPGDRELLTTLAGQAATAIANVQLTAELADRLDELERSRARIVSAQDAERRRIERNIHDGVQQQVVALMMKLRLARNQVGRGDRDPEDAFVELQGDVRELLADLRELAHGIHPPVLSDGGLLAAVEARTARLPFEVQLTATPGLRARRFSEDVEGAAYFVVCEALTNVAKHAGAGQTSVALKTVDETLSVRIHDDGTGFVNGHRSGTGLTNLRDRVEALGGTFEVDTGRGRGTSVCAQLPLQATGAGR